MESSVSGVFVLGWCRALVDFCQDKIGLARHRRTAYDSGVPDKEGARLGRLNTHKRTDRAMRFFYVRMPSCALYERRWRGSLRACWFSFVYQSSNPAICRSPRLDAGRGLPHTKEAIMPGTATSQQSREFTLTASETCVVRAYRNIREVLQMKAVAFALMTAVRFCRLQTVALPLVSGGAA